MTRKQMLDWIAFIRECAYKEAEDAYVSGGRESYEAVQRQADEQIDSEWREWQKTQLKEAK